MKIWRVMMSLELCLLLLALLCAIMAAGSFLLTGQYAAAINGMPLMAWMRAVPVGASWWLWLTLVLIGGIAINTLLCSAETILSRWKKGALTALLAAQLMHAGFLLILLAHLTSALWSSVDQLEVHEGSLATLPNGAQFGIAALSISVSPKGMPIGFSSELVTNLNNPTERTIISPNHPWFSGGYGVYIKQAEMYPFKRALFEIHREPGAGLALAGSLLFVAGNVLLLTIRSNVRENGP
jgi:hypothetical protein